MPTQKNPCCRELCKKPAPPTLASLVQREIIDELIDALSWAIRIFNTNCRRILHVLAHEPEAYSSRYFPNPDKLPDTIATIVDAGPENGRDERHCFTRLMRATSNIPDYLIPYDNPILRDFGLAVWGEVAILEQHLHCRELIRYETALKDFIFCAFNPTNRIRPIPEKTASIMEKVSVLNNARQALYEAYKEREYREKDEQAHLQYLCKMIESTLKDPIDGVNRHIDAAQSAVSKHIETAQSAVSKQIDTVDKHIETAQNRVIKSIQARATSDFEEEAPPEPGKRKQLYAVIQYLANPKNARSIHNACKKTFVAIKDGFSSNHTLYVFCKRNDFKIVKWVEDYRISPFEIV